LRYQQLQHVLECYLSALTQAHNRFATRLLPYQREIVHDGRAVVRSQPRNPLFRCVKSLLLLWKPHSWF